MTNIQHADANLRQVLECVREAPLSHLPGNRRALHDMSNVRDHSDFGADIPVVLSAKTSSHTRDRESHSWTEKPHRALKSGVVAALCHHTR